MDANKTSTVKENSSAFPLKTLMFLIILIAVQVMLCIFAISYEPSPACIITDYSLVLAPEEDGCLKADYYFCGYVSKKYSEIDAIEIVMPDMKYEVDDTSLSSNIGNFKKITDNKGYCSLLLNFNDEYASGEKFDFSFSLVHKDQYHYRKGTAYYNFTAPWFNLLPVESYIFTWNEGYGFVSNADDCSDGVHTWKGKLDFGEYRLLTVSSGDELIDTEGELREPGAYNAMIRKKSDAINLTAVIELILISVCIILIDCIISYFKGHGILRVRKIYMHIDGRTNPSYLLFSRINAPVSVKINFFGRPRKGPSIVEIYDKKNDN